MPQIIEGRDAARCYGSFNLAVTVSAAPKVFSDFPASMSVEAAVADIAEMYGVSPNAVKICNVVRVA